MKLQQLKKAQTMNPQTIKTQNDKTLKKHAGLTIIETMAVIVIIAILATIAASGISSYIDRANYTKTASDLGSYDYAIQTMMLEHPAVVSGASETDDAATEAAILDLMTTTFPVELSMDATTEQPTMVDPWGNTYMVEIDYGSKTTEYTTECFIYIYTYGSDATTAGADDAYLVVQYSDGEVFSDIQTNVDYDGTHVALGTI